MHFILEPAIFPPTLFMKGQIICHIIWHIKGSASFFISFLIGTDAGSVVGQAFSELISGFFRSAESAGGIMGGASAGSVNSAIDIALSSGGG